jgi:hypothetical protein
VRALPLPVGITFLVILLWFFPTFVPICLFLKSLTLISFLSEMSFSFLYRLLNLWNFFPLSLPAPSAHVAPRFLASALSLSLFLFLRGRRYRGVLTVHGSMGTIIRRCGEKVDDFASPFVSDIFFAFLLILFPQEKQSTHYHRSK